MISLSLDIYTGLGMAQAPFFSEQDVKQNTLNVLKWTKGTGTQQQVNSLQAYINI